MRNSYCNFDLRHKYNTVLSILLYKPRKIAFSLCMISFNFLGFINHTCHHLLLSTSCSYHIDILFHFAGIVNLKSCHVPYWWFQTVPFCFTPNFPSLSPLSCSKAKLSTGGKRYCRHSSKDVSGFKTNSFQGGELVDFRGFSTSMCFVCCVERQDFFSVVDVRITV